MSESDIIQDAVHRPKGGPVNPSPGCVQPLTIPSVYSGFPVSLLQPQQHTSGLGQAVDVRKSQSHHTSEMQTPMYPHSCELPP